MTVLLAVMLSGLARAEDELLLLGGRAVAEVWQDASLATVYKTTGFGVSGTFSIRPHAWLSIDGELGLIRLSGKEEQAIQMVPLALDLSARVDRDDMELFFGVGPALVPFADSGLTVITGTKLGLDVQAGARFATDLVNPSMSSTSPVQRVDAEFFVGRRQHFSQGVTDRLDLSAWRVGAGLGVRL